jgi:hypothetical protein
MFQGNRLILSVLQSLPISRDMRCRSHLSGLFKAGYRINAIAGETTPLRLYACVD